MRRCETWSGPGKTPERGTPAKQRTAAFLLRHGHRYPGKTTWGRGYWRWLRERAMPHPAQQIVLQEYLAAVQEATARVQRLTTQIRELLPQWHWQPVVRALQALRGVSLLVAATVVAEIGDLSRFQNPRELMAYLGRVPLGDLSWHHRAPGRHYQDWQRPCPSGNWWKRPGPIVSRPASPEHYGSV